MVGNAIDLGLYQPEIIKSKHDKLSNAENAKTSESLWMLARTA